MWITIVCLYVEDISCCSHVGSLPPQNCIFFVLCCHIPLCESVRMCIYVRLWHERVQRVMHQSMLVCWMLRGQKQIQSDAIESQGKQGQAMLRKWRSLSWFIGWCALCMRRTCEIEMQLITLLRFVSRRHSLNIWVLLTLKCTLHSDRFYLIASFGN